MYIKVAGASIRTLHISIKMRLPDELTDVIKAGG
jgi:hypothetical protein